MHFHPKDRRSGFNLVELMSVLAAAMALAAMIVPAVQQTREAARIAACKNNVAQIGLALQNYQMAHRVLPSGCVNTLRPIQSTENQNESHIGWIPQILPFLEQANAFHHIDFNQSVYAAKNQSVRKLSIAVLNCPAQFQSPNPSVGVSSYSGVHNDFETPIDVNQNGVLYLNSSIRLEQVADGCSNTLFIMESWHTSSSDLGWMSGTRSTLRNGVIRVQSPGAPAQYERHPQTMTGNQLPGSVGGPTSSHRSGFHVGVGDGSVRFINASVSTRLLRNLCHRADGEMLDDF